LNAGTIAHQFAPTPLMNAADGAREVLLIASAIAPVATGPVIGKTPPAHTIPTTDSEPAKLPRNDHVSTRATGPARSVLMGGSDCVSILPVSNSLPERVIIDKPTGNTAPLISATAPGATAFAHPPATTVKKAACQHLDSRSLALCHTLGCQLIDCNVRAKWRRRIARRRCWCCGVSH
jgi:hypothetical protein